MVQFECPRHWKPSVSFTFGVGRIPFSHNWPCGVIRNGSPVWTWKSCKMGCKWSSLNAPGTENPLSHPLLEFSLQLRPASSLWKLMKGCVKQFPSYRKFDHHVIEILKNKIWKDTEKLRKWLGEGEAPYDQGQDRGRGVQVVIFVINFQLRPQLFKPSTELFSSDFREWDCESRERRRHNMAWSLPRVPMVFISSWLWNPSLTQGFLT